MTSVSVRRLPGRTGTTPVVIAVVLLMAFLVVFALSPSLNPLDIVAGRFLEVPVPNVIGLTQDRALVELDRAQLAGDVQFVYSSTVPRNKVVEQTPRDATTIRRDSAVKLRVSRGPAFFTLPDFAGSSEADVKAALAPFDIDVSVELVNSENVPAGQVISQSPAVGVVAVGGSTVTIQLSTGPVIRTVPEVSGLPSEGAAYKLGKAGFVLGELKLADHPTVPVGGIIGTEPGAGTQLARDTPVSIVVSAGPAPVALPKVTGQGRDAASRALLDLGFIVAEVSQQGVVSDRLDGVVMGQNPVEGTMLRPGTVVTVTVRRAAKPPPPPVPATVPPPTLPPTIPTTTAPPATVPPTAPPTAAPDTSAPPGP